MNFYNNFPAAGFGKLLSTDCLGVEQLISEIVEDNSQNHVFFIYNDNSILSLCEMNDERGSFARIIVRDLTGKYTWDSQITYESKKIPKMKFPIDIGDTTSTPNSNFVK
jgi:hypothetical protein